MKKIILILLVAVISSVLAYGWTTLTPITFGVAPQGNTDSAKTDTFGWYTLASTSTRLVIYYRLASTHDNPLCSLLLQTRKGSSRDTMLVSNRILKAIADSSDTVHQFTIYPDSQNVKSYRLIIFSARDTTKGYIFTKEQ